MASSAVDSAVDLTREQQAALNLIVGKTIDRMRAQNPNDSLGPAQPDSEAEEESS